MGAAHIHLHDLAELVARREEVRVTAVVDVDRDRADRWAARFPDATAHVTVDPLMDIDGLLLYGDPRHRPAGWEDCAGTGVPVFVEKPLGVTEAQAQTTAGAIVGPLQIGFFLRYWPALVELRSQVRNGTIGTTTNMDIQFVHNGLAAGWFDEEFRWMAHPRAGGVGFFDLASHAVDVLHWITGQPVHPLAVHTPREHHGTASLRAGDSIDCQIECGWQADDLRIKVTVEGTGGTLSAGAGILSLDGQTVLDDVAPSASAAVGAWLDAVYHQGPVGLVTAQEGIDAARSIDTLRGMSNKRERQAGHGGRR